jgi:hypothetical protein
MHTHDWGMWLGHDPTFFEMGGTGPYRYYRVCEVFGCTAKQKAEDLQATGLVAVTTVEADREHIKQKMESWKTR